MFQRRTKRGLRIKCFLVWLLFYISSSFLPVQGTSLQLHRNPSAQLISSPVDYRYFIGPYHILSLNIVCVVANGDHRHQLIFLGPQTSMSNGITNVAEECHRILERVRYVISPIDAASKSS